MSIRNVINFTSAETLVNAASLIYKHVDVRTKQDEFKFLDLLYFLICANFYKANNEAIMETGMEEHFLYSYTDTCFFLFPWFNKEHEGILRTRLIIDRKSLTKGKVENFFNKSIDEILFLPKNNFLNLSNDSGIGYQLAEMEDEIRPDILDGLVRVQKKTGTLTTSRIKEFLTYYSFTFIMGFLGEDVLSFPYKLIDDILGNIEKACDEATFRLQCRYEQIDPKNVIASNIDNMYIPEISKMYMDYIFESKTY